MTTVPSPATSLAERLFAGSSPWSGLPFWADGGPGGRHVLAALPDRVERLSVSQLPPKGLLPWLRERLDAATDPNILVVALLSYDAGRNLEAIADLGVGLGAAEPPVPDVVVARFPAHWVIEGEGAPFMVGAQSDRKRLARWVETRTASVSGPPATVPREPLGRRAPPVSSLGPVRYEAAVDEILEGITAGDFYEVNLARRLSVPFTAATGALPLYLELRKRTRAPYGALWALDEELWLASGSPECLFEWDPQTREVHSYPIKGTRPRGSSESDDQALAAALAMSVKDRAEHVMIVDLVRNDLGRIAEPGSVVVKDLFGVHSFETVHHMISDVAARATAGADVIDIIGALFPGGSITGAPKIAAMNAIERLEGVRRGWYCGSLGVIDRGGRATFNILIRTAVAANGRLTYHTGGAIVADSDTAEEWAETETKADAFVAALEATRAG